jgi:Transglutaminase-like superfamily
VSHGNLPARLSAIDKARLAIEIVAAYTRVLWLMRRDGLPGTIAVLRAPTYAGPATAAVGSAATAAGDPLVLGRQLGRAVVRTLAPLPRGSRCLTRSLVLLALLARRGVTVGLVIAVQPSADPSLDAHAWVEVDGSPLLAPALNYGRLVTL